MPISINHMSDTKSSDRPAVPRDLDLLKNGVAYLAHQPGRLHSEATQRWLLASLGMLIGDVDRLGRMEVDVRRT